MTLTPLKQNFPKLLAMEIVEGIANGSIAGMWLTKDNIENAKEKFETILEDDAILLLEKFDKDRQSGYNHWNMFN